MNISQRSGSIIESILELKKRMFSRGYDSARKALSDVHPENHFIVMDGQRIKNMYELIYTLRDMSEDSFSHHVNDEKNDFAEWINHCLGDGLLADEVRGLKDKYNITMTIADRYVKLHNMIK